MHIFQRNDKQIAPPSRGHTTKTHVTRQPLSLAVAFLASFVLQSAVSVMQAMPVSAATSNIKVATYNILKTEGGTPWSTQNRGEKIMSYLKTVDVAGLQEVSDSAWSDLRGDLKKAGYSTTKNKLTVAITWKDSRFSLIEQGDTIVLNRVTCGDESGIIKHAIWVKLKETSSGKEFYFLTSHLDVHTQTCRLKQIKNISSMMQSDLSGTNPIIFVGDMNAKMGSKEDERIKAIGFSNSYSSAQSKVNVNSSSFVGSVGGSRQSGKPIDHIYIKGGVSVSSIEIKDQVGSDHLPVESRVSLSTTNLTVGTYNILGYYHGDGSAYDPKRLQQIVKNINDMKYDVVGLQEYRNQQSGDPKALENALKKLNPSWTMSYSDKSMGRGFDDDQLNIVYNSNTVKLLEDTSIKAISSRYSACDSGGTGSARIARFSTISGGEEFLVINVHPTPNHSDSDCDKERLAVVKGAISHSTVENYSGPLFLVGDFNANPKGSRRDEGNVERYLESVGYANARDIPNAVRNSGGTIDHVYYKTSSIAPPSAYETLNCKQIPEGDARKFTSSTTCASDHTPVKAVFGGVSNNTCTSTTDPAVAEQYATWGVGHYGNECTCSEGSSSIGNNTDYAGNQVLTDAQMKKVTDNKPFYEKSAAKSSIPWQIIAAIHVRESGLSRSGPANGQGPYQDYGRKDIPSSLKSGSGWKTGEYSDEEFQTATDWAAEHIKNNYSLHPEKLASDAAEVKNLFFRYNGQAAVYKTQAEKLGYNGSTEGYEGSPYVMNRADKERDPTVEPTKSNKTWGQIKTDGGGISYPANSDYGAYVIFQALGGSTAGATTTSTDANGCATTLSASGSEKKLQELAKAYTQSWEVSKTKSQTKPYQEAVKRSKYQPTCPGNDCGSFVYILMHESGWDTNYGGGSGQTDHMQSWFADSGNGWSPVEGLKSVSGSSISAAKLRPGDVLLREGHIYVFVGDIFGDKTLYFASASNCSRSPAYHTFTDPGTYTVYRKDGGTVL